MRYNDLRPRPSDECQMHDAQLTQPVVAVGDVVGVDGADVRVRLEAGGIEPPSPLSNRPLLACYRGCTC